MNLTEFYKEHQSKRSTFLDEEQFSSLLLMFPAMLVGIADGVLDAREKQNIATAILDVVDDELVGFEMYSELIYLMFADEATQNTALACLKELITDNEEQKLAVIDIMATVAATTEGLSKPELDKILELKKYLSINV